MLYVEIADTPDLWRQGLMFRGHLPKNAGMLFKFNNPQILKFWGMNTYIPLDIAFVNNDNKIIKIDRIKTCFQKMSLSAVSSDDKCIIAIEANDGFFRNNEIKVGDMIHVKKDREKTVVEFLNAKILNKK